MKTVTFIRNLDIVENENNIPSHIIDALDEFFYDREWDFIKIQYEGEYDEERDIFIISSIKDGCGNIIDRETMEYAWEFLHPMFRKHIKF